MRELLQFLQSDFTPMPMRIKISWLFMRITLTAETFADGLRKVCSLNDEEYNECVKILDGIYTFYMLKKAGTI